MDAAHQERRGLRRELVSFLELAGVTSLAVAQPVLSVFADAPEEFLARRAPTGAIVTFALVVTLGPAVLLQGAELVIQVAAPRFRPLVHAAIIGAVAGLFVSEVAGGALDLPPWVFLALWGLSGVALALAYVRSTGVRTATRYLGAAPFAFLALFLFASPVSPLITSGGIDVAEVAVERPAPVVLLVLDELPTASLLDGEGRIDEDRFPAVASLADDATWYRNHTTVAPATTAAVPAIATGQLPDEIGAAPVASEFPESLFTLLGDSYEVRATESFTRLCPPEICAPGPAPAFSSTVRGLLDRAGDALRSIAWPAGGRLDLSFTVPTSPVDSGAPDRLRDFARTAGTPGTGTRPTFDYAHVLLPHQPFDFVPTGARYDGPDPLRGAEFQTWSDAGTAAVGEERHLLQLGLTDRLVGQLLDRMRDDGTYDDALIVVTSDHGIAFTADEPLRGLSHASASDTAWVPLLVKHPGQRQAAEDDRPAETIDIVPTIAEILRVDLPWAVDGRSLLGPDRSDPTDDLSRSARVLDWSFNEVAADDDGFARVDRASTFEELLGTDPPEGSAHPHAGLIGRVVADLDVGAPDDLGLTREIPADGFVVADPASELPVYVHGVYEGAPVGTVAIALDGTVVAVSETYQRRYGISDFQAVLPYEELDRGAHDVEVYLVEGPPDEPTLRSAGPF